MSLTQSTQIYLGNPTLTFDWNDRVGRQERGQMAFTATVEVTPSGTPPDTTILLYAIRAWIDHQLAPSESSRR